MRRLGRVRRAALLVVRVVMLLLALQVTGAVHVAEDLAGDCAALRLEEPADCPSDPGDCPPGCPNCHGHGVAAPPTAQDSPFEIASRVVPSSFPGRTDELPISAPVSSLFRPPRHS